MNEETIVAHNNMLKKLDEFTKAFSDVKRELADFKKEVREHSKQRDDKIDSMFSVYTSGKTSIKFAKGVFYTTLAIGSAYLVFKQIFGVTFK
jgi:hypothetical protein